MTVKLLWLLLFKARKIEFIKSALFESVILAILAILYVNIWGFPTFFIADRVYIDKGCKQGLLDRACNLCQCFSTVRGGWGVLRYSVERISALLLDTMYTITRLYISSNFLHRIIWCSFCYRDALNRDLSVSGYCTWIEFRDGRIVALCIC